MTVLLVCAVLGQSALLVHAVIRPRSAPLPIAAVAPAPSDTPAARIAAAHLFGSIAEPAVVPGDDLALAGTLAFPDPAAGFAVVKRGGVQRNVRAGAAIDAGLVLAEVHADRIVVDAHGERRTVLLPRDARAGVASRLASANGANVERRAARRLGAARPARESFAVAERKAVAPHDPPPAVIALLRPGPAAIAARSRALRSRELASDE